MTTLLIDGDIEAYRAAIFHESAVDWGDGEVHKIPSLAHSYAMMADAIADYKEKLGADKVIVCLSSDMNWRKEIWSEYKAHRDPSTRPVALDQCKAWLSARYEVLKFYGLEADDVMGIMATAEPGRFIIVSIDKDLKSIPGMLFNPRHPEEGVITIDPDSAFIWHMKQTLMGDSSDGYKGCPGIGPKKAEKIIAGAIEADPEHWKESIWKAVVEAFVSKGQTVADALLNSRLSRILQKGEYKVGEPGVLLWEPPSSSDSVTERELVKIPLRENSRSVY